MYRRQDTIFLNYTQFFINFSKSLAKKFLIFRNFEPSSSLILSFEKSSGEWVGLSWLVSTD